MPTARPGAGRTARAKALEPRVREAIATLDAQGRWIGSGGKRVSGTQVTTGAFIMNVRALADYLEAVK